MVNESSVVVAEVAYFWVSSCPDVPRLKIRVRIVEISLEADFIGRDEQQEQTVKTYSEEHGY